jgi:hypothetical protein
LLVLHGSNHVGNPEEENNGYVVFKWSIYRSAGKQSWNF